MISIAIDGPAGAGKSTVAKIIAANLNILYLDTGAMYRAVALFALDHGIDPMDESRVVSVLGEIDIEIKYIDGSQHVFLNKVDVSTRIREHRMSKAASDISRIPAVRLKLVELQRKIASSNDVIMDGRDIGSFVLPNANYKFFLTASASIRAKRRYDELKQKGMEEDYQKILADIIVRDYNDSTRDFAPLVKTADAIEVDTSSMNIDEVVEYITARVR